MAKDRSFRVSCILAVVFLSINSRVYSSQDDDRKGHFFEGSSFHQLKKPLSLPHRSASTSIVRSYKRSFNGFAAKLTKQEAKKLAKKDGVISVFPSQTYHVQTTKSWDYIGFPNTVKLNPTVEGNTIIGVIDSGAYPNSESFNDKGFGPPPTKWKGSCNGGTNIACNNTVLCIYGGTAVDGLDHGTHNASTAAGNAVEGTSFFGLANGTARRSCPSSRIAIYRVCDSQGNCEGDGILAAFDDAIADGKSGPNPQTVFSVALGSSLWQLARLTGSSSSSFACLSLCLDMRKVYGKILVCEGGDSTMAAEAAVYNASGISLKPELPDAALVFPLPAVTQDDSAFEILVSYHNSTRRAATEGDDRSVKFNVISGTSMPCPHVASAAAYVKTFHPGWSPSAIKSALMTSASVSKPFKLVLNWTVTNVGFPNSTYKAEAVSSSNVNIIVVPEILSSKSVSD
ncbi:hypothetical protein CRG98_046898 [Punica granatum]|uniref:Uncharacterized protein n=1 Tax=Punica granatum TaxID=22663 RepID=A0A2I0HLZ3_PUNGR|nr:hypothetical protein CRG98_046898 [Punica granatum]